MKAAALSSTTVKPERRHVVGSMLLRHQISDRRRLPRSQSPPVSAKACRSRCATLAGLILKLFVLRRRRRRHMALTPWAHGLNVRPLQKKSASASPWPSPSRSAPGAPGPRWSTMATDSRLGAA